MGGKRPRYSPIRTPRDRSNWIPDDLNQAMGQRCDQREDDQTRNYLPPRRWQEDVRDDPEERCDLEDDKPDKGPAEAEEYHLVKLIDFRNNSNGVVSGHLLLPSSRPCAGIHREENWKQAA